MRIAILTLMLAAAGCMSDAQRAYDQVSAEKIKEGSHPRLQIGMPIQEATEYLETNGFHRENRHLAAGFYEERGFHLTYQQLTGTTFTDIGTTTLHYVNILPHESTMVVTHPEVHVLLIPDGDRLGDVKSEIINTSFNSASKNP